MNPPVARPLRALLMAACTALALSLGTPPAQADVGRDEAAATAQRAAGGRVLSVERAESGRRTVWRVKLITGQGELRIVLVDAATGRVVG